MFYFTRNHGLRAEKCQLDPSHPTHKLLAVGANASIPYEVGAYVSKWAIIDDSIKSLFLKIAFEMN